MSNGRRRAGTAAAALAAVVVAGGSALAGNAPQHRAPARPAPPVGKGVSVEMVPFPDRGAPVQVVRGGLTPTPAALQDQKRHVEVVSFGGGRADRVMVIHGAALARGADWRVETVRFSDPREQSVRVVRGPAPPETFSLDLFGPADAGELDRIAFAVDGIESRHGADPRMWRPEFAGPQGPMQVSAAAAFDVGGGDRFDLRQNRTLGRAYLAQMFRRYGNWGDALAAYNWGPGNLDQWIAAGRPPDRLPPGVAYYVARVLRDALITTASGW